MAAGLGFKDFTTGEVLTAADVDGYLMQGIWVFASAAARDAAVTSPQEGNACYLKDTNQVLTYSGSAWVAVGGGSPLTTKGDLYGFSTVDARIPIGANDTVLTADSTQTLGLKWATPTGAAFVGCQATSTATPQAISNATATKVNLDSEDFDTDGFHSNVTNNTRITIPAGKGGYYFVYGLIHWSNNTTGRRVLYFSKNNSTDVQSEGFSVATNTQYPAIWLARVFNLAAADYLELEAFQTSGGSLNLNNDPTTIKFGVYKIG
jgi:hypothetical protein